MEEGDSEEDKCKGLDAVSRIETGLSGEEL